MVRISLIAINLTSVCTSMEEVFNDRFMVDVNLKFYRNINETFFGKHNNRMVEMVEHAASFAKEKRTASINY